jgi:twitching motility protein PilT
LVKSNHPGELKAKLERAKRGLFDDDAPGEDDEIEEDED